MIQFGCPHSKDPNSPRAGTGDAPVRHDRRTSTRRTRKLSNEPGTLSMANTGRRTAAAASSSSTPSHNAYLDWFTPGQSKHPVFGKVTDGLDVVKKIEKTPSGAGRPAEDAGQDEQDHRQRRLIAAATHR